MQAADVVEIRVAQPDPPEIGRVDDRFECPHEIRALESGPGLDEDGLGALDDERVDRD